MATFHENLVQSFTNFKNKYIVPIQTALNNKQDKTDSTLDTTNKTITGAINEVNNSLSNKASWNLNSPSTTYLGWTIGSGDETNATPVHWDASIGFPYVYIDGVKHYLIRKADVQNSLNEANGQVPLSAYQGYIMSRDIPWYGTSSTAASTIAKTATTSDSKFALTTGAKVSIKFTYDNTASAPTLNVDSTGAKSIKAYGTTAPTSWWQAGDVVTFTYDGTNWIMGATEGQIAQLKTDKASKSWTRLASFSHQDIKTTLNYALPDVLKNASEIMLYIGIPTISSSKRFMYFIKDSNAPIGYTYGEGSYKTDSCLQYNSSTHSITCPQENTIGWGSGVAKIIGILYR